jgi:hypothetical protein
MCRRVREGDKVRRFVEHHLRLPRLRANRVSRHRTSRTSTLYRSPDLVEGQDDLEIGAALIVLYLSPSRAEQMSWYLAPTSCRGAIFGVLYD